MAIKFIKDDISELLSKYRSQFHIVTTDTINAEKDVVLIEGCNIIFNEFLKKKVPQQHAIDFKYGYFNVLFDPLSAGSYVFIAYDPRNPLIFNNDDDGDSSSWNGNSNF